MIDINVNTEAGPAVVRLGFPPASLLKFPPRELPEPLPAPLVSEPTWNQPFNIPPELYKQLLDVRVPITIASVYAVTVIIINRINKSRGYKPWGFSQTRLFKLFVILHNVFLAIYSAWTFVGMLQAFRNSWPHREDPHGVVGVLDSLCKINGPRGYGNAAIYDSVTDQWKLPNPEYRLAAGGVPDATDVGRMWNQGLAYLGWIFYLSKFYEVLDTAIILAKGKKSSTLQTYHHAGAMMCMWAGIRYMAPPILIFTLVNSGIHAMMYTYYTLTALHIRVPGVIKRSLTTMQITQFVIGTTWAASYLFISYTLPGKLSTASAAAASVTSAVEAAAATASAVGLGPWLKKLGLRAAGAEGAAENVGYAYADVPSSSGAQRTPVGPMITCIDTTGQAFAIWLNVMYLLPLTYLFVRFFVRSYLHRKEPSQPHPTHIHAAERAGLDALKGVRREIEKSVEMNGEISTEDEAVQKAQTQKASGKKAQSQIADKSPIRTRSGANQKKRGTKEESEEGFEAVPPKKGAKPQTKEELEAFPDVPDVKDSNPFGVLDKAA